MSPNSASPVLPEDRDRSAKWAPADRQVAPTRRQARLEAIGRRRRAKWRPRDGLGDGENPARIIWPSGDHVEGQAALSQFAIKKGNHDRVRLPCREQLGQSRIPERHRFFEGRG